MNYRLIRHCLSFAVHDSVPVMFSELFAIFFPPQILYMRQDKEMILVLNKVDLIYRKGQLFNYVRTLTGGLVGEHKSHQTFLEMEKESKQRYEERRLDPKEMARRLIAENEATVEGTKDF